MAFPVTNFIRRGGAKLQRDVEALLVAEDLPGRGDGVGRPTRDVNGSGRS